jgi:predicted nucleic acid-binding protein
VTLVVDAGAAVAALVDAGPTGQWAGVELRRSGLAAPHLMPVEAANILRRAARAGDLPVDTAAMAHDDLVQLRVELFPYHPFAHRVWQLRENLTTYDAWYVALAEALDAALITVDGRIARTPGLRCSVLLPPT